MSEPIVRLLKFAVNHFLHIFKMKELYEVIQSMYYRKTQYIPRIKTVVYDIKFWVCGILQLGCHPLTEGFLANLTRISLKTLTGIG